MSSNYISRKNLAAVSPLAIAIGILCFAGTPAFASCTSTWSLNSSGNWFNGGGGNWTPAGNPNSSSASVCIVDGTSTVTLNQSATVGELTIASGNALDLASTLFVSGPTINNAGTISAPGETLQLTATTTLSGGGNVQMSNGGVIDQNVGGLTLNNVDNTIEGSGQIGVNGLALDNQSSGTVSANIDGATLTLNGGGAVTNAGTLQATGGGLLQISNAVDNAGGNITAVGGTPGGTVDISATITGGTLNTTGNGVMQTNGSATLSGVTLSAGSTYTGAGTTYLSGTITNNGTFTDSGATLQTLGGDVTLQGGGAVQLSNGAVFDQNAGGQTLHNVDNTIEGSGQIGVNGLGLDNQSGGTVDANLSGKTLTLNGGGLVTNAGLLEATNGGVLQISNAVSNTGGNITAAAGSTVFVSAEITGGTLSTTGTGVMETNGSAMLNGVYVPLGSTYTASGTTYLEGTFTGNGTITDSGATLQTFGGDLTLNGGGTVQLSNGAVFDQNAGGETLNNIDYVIEGSGQIGVNGLALDNEDGGYVIANLSGQRLTLNGSGVTNGWYLEAQNGGILQISTNVVNNDGLDSSIISEGAGSIVDVSATITGGRLVTTAGGVIQTNGSATLSGVTVQAGSTYTGAGTTYLNGTITNNGTITDSGATLQTLGGDVTLQGGGAVQLSNGAVFDQNAGGQTLHNVDNTIEGSGQLGVNGLALANQSGGTVNANLSGKTLTLNGGGLVTNEGLLEATSGGALQISNAVTNTGGNITAATGSTVFVSAAITGGTLNTTGTGVMETNGSATLNGVTLSTGSTYTGSGTTYLSGTIINNGAITDSGATLQTLGGDVTLTGQGTVQLSNNAVFDQNAGGQTLHNVNNLIEGSGTIGVNGLALDNQLFGFVRANLSGQTLTLNGSGVSNAGDLQAEDGGILQISTNVTSTASGSSIFVEGAGSTVDVSATINGGFLFTTDGGVMQTKGNATLNGVTVGGGSTYTGSGTTYLSGTITLFGNGAITDSGATLQTLGGDVTLNGGGTVQMSNGGLIDQNSGGQTLHNVNDTIEGSGQIGVNGLALDNQAGGTIDANVSGQTLYMNGGGGFTNHGTVVVSAGSALQVSSTSFVQTQNSSFVPVTEVDGTLTAPSGFSLQGGVLKGTGTVVANVDNSGGAIAAGDPLGILTIQGNYTQGAGGAFDELITGRVPGTGYSQLDVTGSASLAGLLDLTTSKNFEFRIGDTFAILDFGSVTGNFGSFVADGKSCSSIAADLWKCGAVEIEEQFNSKSLDLVVESGGTITGVPEPSTWAMLLLGFTGLGFAGYRASRNGARTAA